MGFQTGYPTDILTPRCVVKHGNYAVIPKEGLCKNEIPFMEDCDVSILSSPELGSKFVFYKAEVPAGKGTSAPWGREEGIECFAFVYQGKGTLSTGGNTYHVAPGMYLYTAPGEGMEFSNTGEEPMTLLLLRQRYKPLKGYDAPKSYFGNAAEVVPENLFGMENVQRYFLLPTDMSMDLGMYIFYFQPGGCHTYAETHKQEHGMYVLDGEGAYYLDDNWSISKKDDFVWMGPYCPQGAYCVGRKPYIYLLSKDCNRDIDVKRAERQ